MHCISGWDRTPLFVSLLRLSLWAVSSDCSPSSSHTSPNQLLAHPLITILFWVSFCQFFLLIFAFSNSSLPLAHWKIQARFDGGGAPAEYKITCATAAGVLMSNTTRQNTSAVFTGWSCTRQPGAGWDPVSDGGLRLVPVWVKCLYLFIYFFNFTFISW